MTLLLAAVTHVPSPTFQLARLTDCNPEIYRNNDQHAVRPDEWFDAFEKLYQVNVYLIVDWIIIAQQMNRPAFPINSSRMVQNALER